MAVDALLACSPIKIGHLDYTIRIMDEDTAHAEGIHAKIEYDDLEIVVRGIRKPLHLADDVLHEVLHGLYRAFNINPRWGEERIVNALAPALVTVLRDNPKFVQWITTVTQSTPP